MVEDAHVIRIAEELASGTIACAEASDELIRLTKVSPKFVRLVHFLQHYIADEDIRARDEEYAKWQLAKLRILIAEAK